MSDITIAAAAPADACYITHLMRRDYEALSFLPKSAIEREAGRGNILLARVGGDEAGYLYHSPLGGGGARVHQACIQYDARGREYGAALVGALVARCRAARARHIALRCADDLPANAFWRSVGFQKVGQVRGGAWRGRMLNLWFLPLEEGLLG